jgi:SseB protein N-terminal domain
MPDADANTTDSAGVPRAGRTLGPTPFTGDEGTAPPLLEAALGEWSAAAQASAAPGGALAGVVRAWAPSRVMVPIVAVLGEGDEVAAAAASGHGDKSADMALVTLTLPDGRRALPAFSSVASLAAWDRSARPVPVEAARAAQAAVVENCDVVLVDPAGPIACVLPRPAVWAVAQGRDWMPPATDAEVLTGVAALVRAIPPIRAHRCEPDGDAGLTVILGLPTGLAPDEVQQITSRMSELLAADPVVAQRAASIRLSLRAV